MPAWTDQDFEAAYGTGPTHVELLGRLGTAFERVPVQLAYHRVKIQYQLTRTVTNWIQDLGITAGDSVVIAGAGCGWSQEIAEDYFGQAVDWICVETSDYIQTVKDSPETTDIEIRMTAQGITDPTKRAAILAKIDDGGNKSRRPVLNEKLDKNPSRRAVLNAIAKAQPDYVLTEEMLQTMTDAEIQQYGPYLDQLGGRIVHITDTTDAGTLAAVQPVFSWGGQLRWMTLAEWRSLFDSFGLSHEVYSIATRELL